MLTSTRMRAAAARAQLGPAQYFLPGAAGGLFLPQKFDDTFTTDSGSTNVAAAGDAVGRIANRLGAPNLTQATAGSRPTWARIPRGGVRNRLLYTEQFDNEVWTKSDTTISPDAATAPNDTMTADKLIETATTAQHFIRQNFTGVVSGSYNNAVYVKAAERTAAVIIAYDGSTFGGFSINLANGVVAAPPVDLSLTDLSGIAVVSSEGNGWYRGSIQRTQTATTTVQLRVAIQVGSNGIYAGDGTSGIYIWGAQGASTLLAYQRVGAAYDVTQSGVPSIWIPYFDGGDYLTTGVQEFSAAGDLFADAASRWSILLIYSTFQDTASGRVLASKMGTTPANYTFGVIHYDGQLYPQLRGTETAMGASTESGDGRIYALLLTWDGSTAKAYFNRNSPVTLSVGTAAEEAQNILVGARNEASPGLNWLGYLACPFAEDRALSASEATQLMSWAGNYYGTP